MRARYFFGGVVVFVSLLSAVYFSYAFDRYAAHLCAEDKEEAVAVECWYGLIRARLHADGLQAAMRLFARIYEWQPVFAQTGCHVHAHRVGDMAYFDQYLGNSDFEKMDFPQETAACGYGFFHGFFEHLIQNRPDPAFVDTTCTYFDTRLGASMSAIRQICYHGSGHGFMLAVAESMPKSAWGNAHAFVKMPLAHCAALKDDSPREQEECEEGVYNVLVEWMETKQYGFSYDDSKPFAACDNESLYAHKRACYYEMAQKLDRASGWDPERLAEILVSVHDTRLRELAFVVGMTGIMQKYSASDAYIEVIRKCATLQAQEIIPMCITAVVAGLFEHGKPQEEYHEAIATCRLSEVERAGASEACWKTVVHKLSRFYEPTRVQTICKEFPDEWQSLCAL